MRTRNQRVGQARIIGPLGSAHLSEMRQQQQRQQQQQIVVQQMVCSFVVDISLIYIIHKQGNNNTQVMNMMSSRTALTTPTIGGSVIKANKCNICMDIVVDDVELKVRVLEGYWIMKICVDKKYTLIYINTNLYLFKFYIQLFFFCSIATSIDTHCTK
jgi:hypothetical protein